MGNSFLDVLPPPRETQLFSGAMVTPNMMDFLSSRLCSTLDCPTTPGRITLIS
jgi:hypothetical protein